MGRKLKQIVDFYGNDFQSYSLEVQLPLLKSTAESMGFGIKSFNVKDLITLFPTMSSLRTGDTDENFSSTFSHKQY